MPWVLAAWLCLAAVVPDVFGDVGPPNGLANCPCLGTAWSPQDTHPNSISNGKLIFNTAGASYEYPVTYGQNCGQHDQGLPPLCSQASTPEWCQEKWCYVDQTNCNLFLAKSQFFPTENNLYYSYATCNDGASSNSFDGGGGGGTLLDLVQRYLTSSRGQIEQAHTQVVGGMEPCEVSKMCPCLECSQESTWGKKVDITDVGVYHPSLGNYASCLARAISYTYRKVAAKEANRERIGYQYFADQSSGSYVGWPNTDWCPRDFDPRYRPWYAAGSTGPKDVIIVVDISGSMATAGRSTLARTATKAILDTLSWKDFATIVLFNGDVAGVFSPTMVSVTDAQREQMKAWVDSGNWNTGSTNFQAALLGENPSTPGAFKVIADSVSRGSTSMCQKLIMFLTDGEADFGESDYSRTRQLSTEFDAVIFTYALGSGADTEVTKRLACENRGIFYPVPDNADLAQIMANYYSYFADGQQSCTASFVEYKDAFTGSTLYAGCLPMYDRTGSHPSLLGVSCMDLNMLVDIEALKSDDSWRDIVAIASDVSKKCRPLDLSECHLQKLRMKYSSESVCPAGPLVSSNTPCPCLEQGCTDDENFIDEKGYFCDTWVGDNCNQASSSWGYSAGGEALIKSKCRHSCGFCKWLDNCPYSTTSCGSTSLPTQSRACVTDTVTGVDITGCKMSCGEVGNSRYTAPDCATIVGGAERAALTSVRLTALAVSAYVLAAGYC